MPIPEMGYTIVMSGPSGEEGPAEVGFINGGMMQRQEPFISPNIVIDVENFEDALKAVNDAGGSTVAEREAVGDMGFVAYFRDTEGNLIGLWQNATLPG
jgi:predicted enzyme related to lactoylglutathione lyase